MVFTSTRNSSCSVSFSEAVMNCMPNDGGLYVPSETEDLRRWLLYTDDNTSFNSMAGSLTSAFIKDEFSPIICETIVTRAFQFAPEIKQLDEKLFNLELFHTPTGIHRDFGVSYLVSCIETINQLKGGNTVFLDVSAGELGASLARALRGKKTMKAVIVYPKGTVRGMKDEDFIWNGGNIYPVEVSGDEKLCHTIVRQVFADNDYIHNNHITVANTANIGRLLPHSFFYPFAFSRIKNLVSGPIFYALAAGNYSNVVAGLYAWAFALPLNGFIIPSTEALSVDEYNEPVLYDSVIPVAFRNHCDPSGPSNLERLEHVFSTNTMMMKHFVYPCKLSDGEVNAACKELYEKYGVIADRHTSRAFASLKANSSRLDDDGVAVLVSRDSPCLSSDYIEMNIGKKPEMSESIKASLEKVELNRKCITSSVELKSIINSL